MIKKFSIESMVLSIICLADLASTIFLVTYKGYLEGNPLMSFYLQHGIVAFCLAKMALMVFPIIIFEYARRHRPLFTKYALRACIGIYVFLYAANYVEVNGMPYSADTSTQAISRSVVTASMGASR